MFAALEKAKKFAPAAPINQIGPMKDLVTVPKVTSSILCQQK